MSAHARYETIGTKEFGFLILSLWFSLTRKSTESSKIRVRENPKVTLKNVNFFVRENPYSAILYAVI